MLISSDRSSEYLRYRSAYKTGLGLTVGGSVLTLGGGFTFVTGVAVVVAGGITLPLQNTHQRFLEKQTLSSM